MKNWLLIVFPCINERLYEYLKGMFNVIKVQFSHFGSIWTNISETVHVRPMSMKYMCGIVDLQFVSLNFPRIAQNSAESCG